MATEYISNFEKKRKFLLTHEEFFLNGASGFLNLSYEQLLRYKPILTWHHIASNEAIKWNESIIDKFKNEIFVEDDIFPEINCNRSLPWTIQFIERYENLWKWELLADNEHVMGNADIRKYFQNQLSPYMEYYLASSTYTQKHIEFQHPLEIDAAESIDWFHLSRNEMLPWNTELIEKYYDKWNWTVLSTNMSIPWDINLIKKFEDKIDWTIDKVKIVDGEEKITFYANSISANLNIKWDAELLSTFIKKLNTWDISISPKAKWDIDLLSQFEDFWEYGELSKNKSVWDKVFSEFDNPEHLNPLLDAILDKRKV